MTSCKTCHESLAYLTSWFKRVGGEAGVGLGGPYSCGGRSVRQMIAVAMSQVLRLQVETQTLLKSGSSLNQILMAILELCDHSMFEKSGGEKVHSVLSPPHHFVLTHDVYDFAPRNCRFQLRLRGGTEHSRIAPG